jgi:hypothetical protein
MTQPGKLPAGMKMLQAGSAEVAGPRLIRITLPSGNLALEKLAHPATFKAVQDAFSEALNGPVTIELATGAASSVDGRGRITAASARQDKLRRMMDGEPLLTAAVQAFDLELED